MKDNITDNKLICTMLEVTYNKKMQHLTKKDIRELYPSGWFSIKDNNFKKNVLSEALKKNILIKNTELFKSRIEKVIK